MIIGDDESCKITYYMNIAKIHDQSFLNLSDKKILDIFSKEYSHTFNLAPSDDFQIPDLRGHEIKLTI